MIELQDDYLIGLNSLHKCKALKVDVQTDDNLATGISGLYNSNWRPILLALTTVSEQQQPNEYWR